VKKKAEVKPQPKTEKKAEAKPQPKAEKKPSQPSPSREKAEAKPHLPPSIKSNDQPAQGADRSLAEGSDRAEVQILTMHLEKLGAMSPSTRRRSKERWTVNILKKWSAIRTPADY